jgi:hypothetical protein
MFVIVQVNIYMDPTSSYLLCCILELRCNEGSMKIEKCRFCGGSDLLPSLSHVLKMSALKKCHLYSSVCLMSETT